MSITASVDARGLLAKFARLEEGAKAGLKTVVKNYTEKAEQDIKALLDRPVGKTSRGKVRSRGGQPPRTDTGRLKRSLTKKISPKGWVGTVSTSDIATDKQGRRYPWMLESGTKNIRKRPLFKRVQKALKKPFSRDMAAAVSSAVRSANR